uniref:Uncharacterized protein n=1 Tax=Amphimedon queenslandica TaxID=400682 RepID=A0A1X7TU00_AMPQE
MEYIQKAMWHSSRMCVLLMRFFHIYWKLVLVIPVWLLSFDSLSRYSASFYIQNLL